MATWRATGASGGGRRVAARSRRFPSAVPQAGDPACDGLANRALLAPVTRTACSQASARCPACRTCRATLYCCGLLTNLNAVNLIRTAILILSLIGLPFGSLTAASVDCSAVPAPGAEAYAAGHADHLPDKGHGPSDHASGAECPCAMGCAASCAASGSGAVAAAGVRPVAAESQVYRPPGRALFLPGPLLPVLIRPPIPSC